MPQNRERLPSEPLRAIGSRVLSRESHNTRSMNSNGWGASSRDDPLHVSQEAESAQAVGPRRRPPAIQSFFIAGMRVGEGSGLDTMTKKRGWKAYVAVFVAIAFASSVATSLMMMMFQNFNCRTPHDPDDFLAYCRSLGFVDYEHGALYYGLEPKVRDSIRTAQVLFLGSSRVQAAFAANALRKYFKARGIRYFVMGFGYGEASAFGQPVMERSHASPRSSS